mgnify:FL=1|jgi:hypothetical protein
MRIISQNGTIDVPYDMCCVWRKEEVIYCRVVGSDDNVTMATYSSSEKAETVLERFKDNALVLLMDVLVGKITKEYANDFYYQFPKEDLLVERIIPKGGKLPLSDILSIRKKYLNEEKYLNED